LDRDLAGKRHQRQGNRGARGGENIADEAPADRIAASTRGRRTPGRGIFLDLTSNRKGDLIDRFNGGHRR